MSFPKLCEKDGTTARNACSKISDIQGKLIKPFHDSQCTSPIAKLWLMYIDMIMILKRFIYAERAGVWTQHLNEVDNMLPYLVAAGHHNYVACIPHYLKEMKDLPAKGTNCC
jgi:hypothetical protein